jgi:hypothetical protein
MIGLKLERVLAALGKLLRRSPNLEESHNTTSPSGDIGETSAVPNPSLIHKEDLALYQIQV